MIIKIADESQRIEVSIIGGKIPIQAREVLEPKFPTPVFVHESLSFWQLDFTVTEQFSGRIVVNGDTENDAIACAWNKLQKAGVERWLKIVGDKSEPAVEP